MKRTLSNLILSKWTLAFIIALLGGCSDDDVPRNENDSRCRITSAPSYFGSAQAFEYDQSGNLKSRAYEFGVTGFGTFKQTVDENRTVYTYTHNTTTLVETDIYKGGSGNLYDGHPEMLIRHEVHTNENGSTIFDSGLDTVLIFQYDTQDRLHKVSLRHELLAGSVDIIYSKQLYLTVLELSYDDHDNVTNLRQYSIYRDGVYNVNNPSESYFVYLNSDQTIINVTYDDKPSPFSAILPYWKFVQGDWGYVVNSRWPAIIAALSKNNPITISYELYQGNPSETTETTTYDYNEFGFPTGGYTYACQ